MPGLSHLSLYLLCYNSLQAFGWSLSVISMILHLSAFLCSPIFTSLLLFSLWGFLLCRSISLYRLIFSLVTTWTLGQAYASTGNLICLLQTAAFLEVLHGAVGIVPSGALLPLMQWGGRTHFLLAIVRSVDQVQILPSVFITFAAWSVSEVIRYSQYGCSCIKICPYWLTYLRYTAFIILYPIGVGPGEMWLMYKALPYIKLKNLYANFFNQLHFSYHSFVLVLLVLYPFLWLKLYVHMIKQRKSKLKKTSRKKD